LRDEGSIGSEFFDSIAECEVDIAKGIDRNARHDGWQRRTGGSAKFADEGKAARDSSHERVALIPGRRDV
jgi:hypothetical protein